MGSESGLRELRVGVADGRFVWVDAPAPEPVERHLSAAGVSLAPGQKGEVCLEAIELHRRLARSLAEGRLVAFDYGHPARILYHPFARPEGTLAVHSLGRRGGDPLDEPGEVDLTAHVNWDSLMAAGEAEGLHTDRLQRQGMLLTEAGVFDFARNDAEKWRDLPPRRSGWDGRRDLGALPVAGDGGRRNGAVTVRRSSLFSVIPRSAATRDPFESRTVTPKGVPRCARDDKGSARG